MESFAIMAVLSGAVWGVTDRIKQAVGASGYVVNAIAFALAFAFLWLYTMPLASAILADFGSGIGAEPRELAEFVEYALGAVLVVGGSALTHQVFGRK
jgi:hypothetical protein